MPTMSTATVPYFEGVVWNDLKAPENHPGFEYEGFRPGETIVLPRGHVLRDGYCAFLVDTALDLDCKVPMRDGLHIYTNVYRAAQVDAPKQPALIAWSPYGKCAGGKAPQNYDVMGPFHIGVLQVHGCT